MTKYPPDVSRRIQLATGYHWSLGGHDFWSPDEPHVLKEPYRLALVSSQPNHDIYTYACSLSQYPMFSDIPVVVAVIAPAEVHESITPATSFTLCVPTCFTSFHDEIAHTIFMGNIGNIG